jgi:hypothetical protein
VRPSRVRSAVSWLFALVTGGVLALPQQAPAARLAGALRDAEGAAAKGPRAPHPEPRVIVTVTSMDGPHERGAVQRAARETWAGIVRCYKEFGRRLQGVIVLELRISERGKVVDARRGNGGDSKLNSEISDCVMRVLRTKAMPEAAGASTATLEIRLAPGND